MVGERIRGQSGSGESADQGTKADRERARIRGQKRIGRENGIGEWSDMENDLIWE